MENVILVVHIFACIAMTIVVLLQRSEGGALGMGGGGGGGLMSGRGAAGALVRTTMIFGGIFFVTSLALTTIATHASDRRTGVERRLTEEESEAVAPVTDALDPGATLFERLPADPLEDVESEDIVIETPEPAAPVEAESEPVDPLAE